MGELPWGVDGQRVWAFLYENRTADLFGCENYRILPEEWKGKRRANVWSESHESQIIGGTRALAYVFGIEFEISETANKPAGYGFAGLKYVPGKKGTHMQDAVAHGAWWWMMKGRHRVS